MSTKANPVDEFGNGFIGTIENVYVFALRRRVGGSWHIVAEDKNLSVLQAAQFRDKVREAVCHVRPRSELFIVESALDAKSYIETVLKAEENEVEARKNAP